MEANPILFRDLTYQTVVSAALAAKSRAEVPKKAGCEVRSKVIGLDLLSRKSVARSTTSLITRSTHRGGATRRRSLRPLGARSSQEYLPQMASTPRA